MILIYCPCKDREEAKRIAKSLLGKKLIACANIVQSDSIYCWKNKLCSEKEAIAIFKTTEKKSAAAEKETKKLHSYELPAIIKINAKANKEFEKWVDGQIWQSR
jgi:periplasmic divalent cation tolerance protein